MIHTPALLASTNGYPSHRSYRYQYTTAGIRGHTSKSRIDLSNVRRADCEYDFVI